MQIQITKYVKHRYEFHVCGHICDGEGQDSISEYFFPHCLGFWYKRNKRQTEKHLIEPIKVINHAFIFAKNSQ